MKWSVAALAAALAVGSSPLAAQSPPPAGPQPDAATLLFETPAWQAAPAGSRITYRYSRKSGLQAVFGPPAEDRIRITLDPGDAPQNRTVRVEMFFSPERHRPAGPFETAEGNPVLGIFLEHHLGALATTLKANPRYLKNAIRAALRDKAEVARTAVPGAGTDEQGYTVTVRPFRDDPNKARMRGLETMTYTFVAVPTVPGLLVSVEAKASDASGETLVEERLDYDPTP